MYYDSNAGKPIFFPTISKSAVVTLGKGMRRIEDDVMQEGTAGAQATPAASPAPSPQSALGSGQTPSATEAPIQEPAFSMNGLLAQFKANNAAVDKALDGTHLFYFVQTSTGGKLMAKAPGQAQEVELAVLPHSSLGRVSLSPDRKRLVFRFVEQSQKLTHLVVLERGQSPRTLVSLPLVPDLAFENFDVSNDLKNVVFDVRIEELTTLYRLDVESGVPALLLGQDEGGVQPALSPDNQQVAYISSGAIRVKKLVSGEDKVVLQDATLKQFPSWSPDAKKLVYQATNGDEAGFDVYLLDLATGESRRLTSAAGDDLSPAYGPKPGQLYFSSERQTIGQPRLMMLPLDGGESQPEPGASVGVVFPR